MKIEDIAAICHEANRMYCLTIGDTSQPDWMQAPEWQKKSAIDGVEAHLEHPELTPEMSHEYWLKAKEKDGWKYGPVKDAEKKEHPCFVSYGQLAVEQRIKDYLFKAICDNLLPFLNEG